MSICFVKMGDEIKVMTGAGSLFYLMCNIMMVWLKMMMILKLED